SLFRDLCGIKVLDLSDTGVTELPASISNLGNLGSLLLRDCHRLEHVPSLAKNRKLEKLDLHLCDSLKEVPHGMEVLSNLKYLDLTCHAPKLGTRLPAPLIRNFQQTNLSNKSHTINQIKSGTRPHNFVYQTKFRKKQITVFRSRKLYSK